MEQTNERPFTAASFNKYLAERKLMGVQCSECQTLYLPPRAICPKCQSDQMRWLELSGRGKLAAYTAVYIGPTFMNELGFDRANPYLTGVVALNEGVKISARLLGFEEVQPQDVKIDSTMEVDFLKINEGEDSKVQLAFHLV